MNEAGVRDQGTGNRAAVRLRQSSPETMLGFMAVYAIVELLIITFAVWKCWR